MPLGAWQLPNSPAAAKNPKHTDVPHRKQILTVLRPEALPLGRRPFKQKSNQSIRPGGMHRFAKDGPGAGDETRTRDFNLGKEAVAGPIQSAVLVSPVRFLPVFSNRFALGFLR
jgi:hypothetical protein